VFSGSGDGTVRHWDCATGRELRKFDNRPDAIFGLALAERLNTVSTADRRGTLRFWDTATGKRVREIPQVAGGGAAILVSADNRVMVTVDQKALYVLDPATGKELRRVDGICQHFGLSLDGTTLATQQMNESAIHLWNIATGRESRSFSVGYWSPGFAGARTFVFSPDGRLLAAHGKGSIDIWEVLTGQLRRRFRGHLGRLGAMDFVFASDGKTLLSGGDDTTVLIWDVAREGDPAPEQLGSRELQVLWSALGQSDGEKADRAIGKLVAARDTSVKFFGATLQPAPSVDTKHIDEWVENLDSADFATRDRAFRELESCREQATSALRKVLATTPSPELRRRAEALLNTQAPPPQRQWAALRSIEILERINTPLAVRLLEKLVQGAPESLLTREARASLERLRRSPAP
jgi:WD40 repeat protein